MAITLPYRSERKAVKPKSVEEHPNGQIPDEELALCGLGQHLMVKPAAWAMRAMVAAAAEDGIRLASLGTYRDIEQQTELFLRRYSTEPTDRRKVTWEGTDYWLRQGVSGAQVPGTSSHGTGLAIDLADAQQDGTATAISEPTLRWLADNGPSFGYWNTVRSEPWHWFYCLGDEVTDRVGAFEGGGRSGVHAAGATGTRPTLRRGSGGDAVRDVQTMLRSFGSDVDVDGTFGPALDRAVRAFQREQGLAADGIIGSATWQALEAANQTTGDGAEDVGTGSTPAGEATTDVDLRDVAIETHVSQAIRLALAAGEPIDAASALTTAWCTEERSPTGSPAFEHIRTLLGDEFGVTSPLMKVDADDRPIEVVTMSRPFAESLRRHLDSDPSPGIWGRDFIAAAVLTQSDPSLDDAAQRAGTTVAELRRNWFAYVTAIDHRSEHREVDGWRALWRAAGVDPDAESAGEEQESPLDSPDTDTVRSRRERRVIPWVESDVPPGVERSHRPSQLDSLDAKSQAELFATLLVAENVRPPFAIGLLGDWGVGKTFFMRLMQEVVRTTTGADGGDDPVPGSVGRVAQIEFNAWHYIDTDLWASLASHLFDGLAVELRGEKDEPAKIRRELRQRIRSSEQEKAEAEAYIAVVRSERDDAAATLAEREAERRNLAALAEQHRLRRIWRAALRVRPDPDDPERRDWPDVQAAKEQAEAIVGSLGIKGAIDGVADANRAYDELMGLRTPGRGLLASIGAAFSGRRARVSGLVVVLIATLIVLTPWMLDRLGTAVETNADPLTPYVQAVTALGAIAVWAGRSLRSITAAIGYLDVVRAEVQNPRSDSAPTEEELELRRKMKKQDAEISEQRSIIEKADDRIVEARAEIQRIDSGGLVYDFLDGRVSDSRYLDRLGLISVVRRDFQDLRRVLRDWVTHSPGGRSDRPIERIVLYVDDLDRCPPARVVEVLQAVHLLLAFDLFIVVVAVDARWLERSLNETYNPERTSAEGAAHAPRHRFDAHNYLEKIFQIPFTLPAMDDGGYRDLVETMFEAPVTGQGAGEDADAIVGSVTGDGDVTSGPDDASSSEPAGDTTAGDAATSAAQSPAPGSATSGISGAGGDAGSTSGDITPAEQEDARLAAAAQAAASRLEAERIEAERAAAEERLEATLLEDDEKTLIASLQPFISTPRLARRFLNIYRLLRVQRIASLGSLDDYLDGTKRGSYQATLLALAVCVGRPDTASQILSDVARAADHDGSFRDHLDQLAVSYNDDVQRAAAARTGSAPSADEIRLTELRESVTEIGTTMDRIRESDHGLGELDDRLDSFQTCALEVGRYSFSWRRAVTS